MPEHARRISGAVLGAQLRAEVEAIAAQLVEQHGLTGDLNADDLTRAFFDAGVAMGATGCLLALQRRGMISSPEVLP